MTINSVQNSFLCNNITTIPLMVIDSRLCLGMERLKGNGTIINDQIIAGLHASMVTVVHAHSISQVT